MSSDDERYEQAERTFLASQGVEATARWVDLDRVGGRLRVLDAGEGPPAIFVPGVMTGGAIFAGLVARLPGHRCILVDRPGVGLSPMIAEPPTRLEEHQRLADDLVVDVLDGLGLERANLVATSLGSWTAIRSLATNPDRFDRYVGLAFQLGARMERLPKSMRLPAIRAITPRRVKASPGLVKMMLKSAGMRRAVENGRLGDDMIALLVALLRHTDTFYNESFHSPRPGNLRGPTEDIVHSAEVLARVTVPVHLIWGDEDLFGGEAVAREFLSMLPDATLEMVEEAGHAPWLDHPDPVARSVRKHLDG